MVHFSFILKINPLPSSHSEKSTLLLKRRLYGEEVGEAGSLFFLASASHIQISYRTIPKRPGLERRKHLSLPSILNVVLQKWTLDDGDK
jgi:hypothetical protein